MRSSFVSRKIHLAKRELSDKAISRFTKEYIRKGETCTLAQVRDILKAKELPMQMMEYSINGFRESLCWKTDESSYELTIALFPNRKKRMIAVSINRLDIMTNIDAASTPEGVAEFIMAIAQWMPELHAVEQKIEAEEKQRMIVCEIAKDVAIRHLGNKLEEKGYTYKSNWHDGSNTLKIYIHLSESLNVTLEMDLMTDFLDHAARFVDSLPNKIQ